jgi:hypothetical protein
LWWGLAGFGTCIFVSLVGMEPWLFLVCQIIWPFLSVGYVIDEDFDDGTCGKESIAVSEALI